MTNRSFAISNPHMFVTSVYTPENIFDQPADRESGVGLMSPRRLPSEIKRLVKVSNPRPAMRNTREDCNCPNLRQCA